MKIMPQAYRRHVSVYRHGLLSTDGAMALGGAEILKGRSMFVLFLCTTDNAQTDSKQRKYNRKTKKTTHNERYFKKNAYFCNCIWLTNHLPDILIKEALSFFSCWLNLDNSMPYMRNCEQRSSLDSVYVSLYKSNLYTLKGVSCSYLYKGAVQSLTGGKQQACTLFLLCHTNLA